MTTTRELTNPIAQLGEAYGLDEKAVKAVLAKTVMPLCKSTEEAHAFAIVCNEYGLNPFLKEIYAFPAKGGGIVPIVSVDGWYKLMARHPEYAGMEVEETREDGQLVSVTAKVYRKGMDRPAGVATEYLSECRRKTDPWRDQPTRMLTHRAVTQAARRGFGYGALMIEDEFLQMAEREVRDERRAQQRPRTLEDLTPRATNGGPAESERGAEAPEQAPAETAQQRTRSEAQKPATRDDSAAWDAAGAALFSGGDGIGDPEAGQ